MLSSHSHINIEVIASQPLQYPCYPLTNTSMFQLSSRNYFDVHVNVSQPLQYSSCPLTTTSIFQLPSHNHFNIPVILTTTSIFQLVYHRHVNIPVILSQPCQSPKQFLLHKRTCWLECCHHSHLDRGTEYNQWRNS
jgi:hypothetical protein